MYNEIYLIELVKTMQKYGLGANDAWDIVQSEWEYIEDFLHDRPKDIKTLKGLAKDLLTIYMVA
ncbi:hypothetical protein [Nitratifractor sp.]|uniref:hypothetical protein n=1 Tax=Nitratifractor sp. TaxID=2268144 RepID=UPI0025CF4F05|nr:hypothetical protein [Nitratifractor sp.]